MSQEKQFDTYMHYNLYKLKWKGGGELPAELKGAWLTPEEALREAEKYLATRRSRAWRKKNGDSKDEG